MPRPCLPRRARLVKYLRQNLAIAIWIGLDLLLGIEKQSMNKLSVKNLLAYTNHFRQLTKSISPVIVVWTVCRGGSPSASDALRPTSVGFDCYKL